VQSNSRKYNLSIWALGFGYFVFYLPYSGLTKAVTKGLLPGMHGGVSGFEVLPLSVAATMVFMWGFVTVKGWWEYAGHREVFGIKLPVPSAGTFVSGLCMGAIIATTTLAFSFAGASIVLVLVLLRAGVLMLGPVVDVSLGRRVRWFSWTAMGISLVACAVALADISNYSLTAWALIDILVYLTAYLIKFKLMTKLAKSNDKANTIRYFVEEQIVATPVLLAVLGGLALLGKGEVLEGFRSGFTTFLSTAAVIPGILVGAFYAALCVCTTFIFLDRRENTFCIPMHCGSSLLSGVAAAGLLTQLYNQPSTSRAQYESAAIIGVALIFLSPFHHAMERAERFMARVRLRALFAISGLAKRVLDAASDKIKIATLADAVDEGATRYFYKLRRVFLFVCSGNTCRSPLAEAIGNAEIAARLGISLDSMDTAPVRALSAGLTAKPGAPMTPEALQALKELSVPVVGHASRSLTPELLGQAEVVYCMSSSHREAVINMMPTAAAKTWCLDPEGDIEDPTGFGPEVYAKCAERIQSLVCRVLDDAGITASY